MKSKSICLSVTNPFTLFVFLPISWLQADGLTAIEAWLIACIVFVFAALVEYTGILLKMKMRKLTGTKRKKDNYAITDLAFFVFFPILFTIFNVLYWTSICWKRLEEQEKYNLWLVNTHDFLVLSTCTAYTPVLLKFVLYQTLKLRPYVSAQIICVNVK